MYLLKQYCKDTTFLIYYIHFLHHFVVHQYFLSEQPFFDKKGFAFRKLIRTHHHYTPELFNCIDSYIVLYHVVIK